MRPFIGKNVTANIPHLADIYIRTALNSSPEFKKR